MKIFLFLLFVSFFNFSLSLKANNVNIDDFEIDIKQSLNAVLFAKSGSIDRYNKISQSENQVLKDATFLVALPHIKIDLQKIYQLLIKYPELKNILYKFATPILETISKSDNINTEIANKLVNDYFIDSNLSLEQKILLINSCIKLEHTKAKCIRLINSIWSETYFNNISLWNDFLEHYSDILTEDSYFEQIKILLLNKKYSLVDKLKKYITNKSILNTINAAEKISKNNIKNIDFLDKMDKIDDIIAILLIDNLKEKHNPNIYYKIGMKATCQSSSLIKQSLWNKYLYTFHEMIKNATIDEYNKAYELINHCKNFEKNDYFKQQFLSGWILLEYLKEPNEALSHFLQLLADSKDPASLTRGYYWLGRTYHNLGNSDKSDQYYNLAIQHPFYFYGQMAMYETDLDHNDIILNALNKMQLYAKDYDDKTDNIPNLLTYIAKVYYKMGRHDISLFYTRYLLSLNISPEIKVASLYRITNNTEKEFAINVGRYGRINGSPLLDISYPHHDNINYSSIVKAVILKESMFDNSTVSNKNAQGMMQMRTFVFKDIAKELGMKKKKIRNPKDNIIAGSYLLQKLLIRYKNNALALAAYNAGPTNVERWIKGYGKPSSDNRYDNINWIESIPYEETMNYIMRVTETSIVYDVLSKN